jgi:hypothetical protein
MGIYVVDERGNQVSDLADYAQQQGGELWVFTRPGARVSSPVSGLGNTRIMPIPQRPLVVAVPVPDMSQTEAPK